MERMWRKRAAGGWQELWRHDSRATGTAMEFAVFLPPAVADAESPRPTPALFYLSGLTCTWANAAEKANLQFFAARHNFVVVWPDTSPRGLGLPGEDDSYDFGSGAGFYVDATVAPWSQNYKMFEYVSAELPEIVFSRFPVDPARAGVFGHSMGGHGALLCALKKPEVFRSCSAFAPICAPSRCPWGRKALGRIFGRGRIFVAAMGRQRVGGGIKFSRRDFGRFRRRGRVFANAIKARIVARGAGDGGHRGATARASALRPQLLFRLLFRRRSFRSPRAPTRRRRLILASPPSARKSALVRARNRR